MSREEAMRRQDDEACDLANRYSRLDEWHHEWSTRSRWTDWIIPAVMVTGLYLLIIAATMAGEIVGGWAA